MDYLIEIFDADGLRVAAFDDVPLLEAARCAPDRPDLVRGIVPGRVPALAHGGRVRVSVGSRLFCEAEVTRLEPQWGDTRKLILDRYVAFHEVVAFEAERSKEALNTRVSRACTGRAIGSLVRDLVNHAPGRLHYRVAHTEYPEGAQREWQKFSARKAPESELEAGGIAAGQWVGPGRLVTDDAWARDGDTIAGLVVDGAPWPDLRLMMVDAEELTRNARAIERHPEVAAWSDEQYEGSGYRIRAEAARDALQHLIEHAGIDHVELNPHRDASGAFDGRVDAYGRYLGLVYGAGECLNAALVEQHLADVYLHEDGRWLDPELQLKDFYSYAEVAGDSIEPADAPLEAFDFAGGVLEAVALLAYAAGPYGWSVDPDRALAFRRLERPDHVVFYRSADMSVGYGSDSDGIVNVIAVEGSPFGIPLDKTCARDESVDAYGTRFQRFACYGLSREADAGRLAAGLLDDLAYPAPAGHVTFFTGADEYRVGDVVELRGGPLRRLDAPLPGEWGGLFNGTLVGRVAAVRHRFTGRVVTTTLELAPPLRTVGAPLDYIVRSQPGASTLYQFRLDDTTVAADLGFHLD